MSSARAMGGRFARRLLDMTVESVTDQVGSPDTPPRSLRLSPSACPYEHGAAVLSADSGALLALVSRAESDSCEDTTGETIALRVAPFRQLLLSTANLYGQTLSSEHSPEVNPAESACP
jgi:hypothetical protein